MAEVTVDTAIVVAVVAFLAAGVNIAYTALNSAYLEPRRQRRETKEQMGAMRKALYSELMSLYLRLKGEEQEVRASPQEMLASPLYEKVMEDPLTFYRLNDAQAIEGIYRRIRKLRFSFAGEVVSDEDIAAAINNVERDVVRSTMQPLLIGEVCSYKGVDLAKLSQDFGAAAVAVTSEASTEFSPRPDKWVWLNLPLLTDEEWHKQKQAPWPIRPVLRLAHWLLVKIMLRETKFSIR